MISCTLSNAALWSSALWVAASSVMEDQRRRPPGKIDTGTQLRPGALTPQPRDCPDRPGLANSVESPGSVRKYTQIEPQTPVLQSLGGLDLMNLVSKHARMCTRLGLNTRIITAISASDTASTTNRFHSISTFLSSSPPCSHTNASVCWDSEAMSTATESPVCPDQTFACTDPSCSKSPGNTRPCSGNCLVRKQTSRTSPLWRQLSEVAAKPVQQNQLTSSRWARDIVGYKPWLHPAAWKLGLCHSLRKARSKSSTARRYLLQQDGSGGLDGRAAEQ